MCGFFGIWTADGSPVDLESLVEATISLAHRGPDDEGYLLVDSRSGCVVSCLGPDTCPEVVGPRVSSFQHHSFDLALSFGRLSILDLSSAGHQPIGTRDDAYWIDYNGQVYKYVELRNELRGNGYAFETETDTEVVLDHTDALRWRN